MSTGSSRFDPQHLPLPSAAENLAIEQKVTLITGAARCGKSEWAEAMAYYSGKSVTYIATATLDPTDLEWQDRILVHQQRRPPRWKTTSAVTDLALIIRQAQAGECLLIDSLGTWVANLLDLSADEWQQISQELIAVCAANCDKTIIFVAEETGWGVIPAYPSGRLFRDRLGMLTRQIGSISDVVYLIAGGHVLNLSALGRKLVARD